MEYHIWFNNIIIAPLNHIRYSLFSKHASIFHGSQPWTYYIINDLVNVNIIYRLAIVGIILIVNQLNFYRVWSTISGYDI
ncbi:unnamed protein product [Rotaria sp. Silwood1]|nr:unnamed protein product [Rotaria sp. Silwood1]